jgi:CDP-glycerol glycerophosphotransferase (TagB/SpsB family)
VAPTFTQGLSAVEILGERLVESVRGVDDSIRIMIRPHPHSRKTHPALLKVWKKQAAILPRVSVHDEEDLSLMDLFPLADVMVSDVSSAGLAWLATDRPLVCITDPSCATVPSLCT